MENHRLQYLPHLQWSSKVVAWFKWVTMPLIANRIQFQLHKKTISDTQKREFGQARIIIISSRWWWNISVNRLTSYPISVITNLCSFWWYRDTLDINIFCNSELNLHHTVYTNARDNFLAMQSNIFPFTLDPFLIRTTPHQMILFLLKPSLLPRAFTQF